MVFKSAQLGSTTGMNQLANCGVSKTNEDKLMIIRWLEKSAEALDTTGLNYLRQFYSSGYGNVIKMRFKEVSRTLFKISRTW